MLDYHALKELAPSMGVTVKDLLALTEQNDPFYAGLPSRREAAEWFADLWTRFGFQPGSYLRRHHYNLVSQKIPVLKPNGEIYINTVPDSDFMNKAARDAGYLKLIPEDAFSDHRNAEAVIHTEYPFTSTPKAAFGGETPDFNAWVSNTDIMLPYLVGTGGSVPQPYLVEVWIEKSTMNDIIEPLARKLRFNFVSGIGETSTVRTREALERVTDDGRPARIFYISDFDPGGRSMPMAMARKLQWYIDDRRTRDPEFNVDVTLKSIALTPEQCARYELPRIPLKETERRADKFEARFGEGATELDALEALHPGELARIIRREVERYIDKGLDSRVYAVSSDFKRTVRQIEEEVLERHNIEEFRERYNEIVAFHQNSLEEDMQNLLEDAQETWAEVSEELKELVPAFNGELPRPEVTGDTEEPLFDSKRDYFTQGGFYPTFSK